MSNENKPLSVEIIHEPSTYALADALSCLAHDWSVGKIGAYNLNNLDARYSSVDFSWKSRDEKREYGVRISRELDESATSYIILISEAKVNAGDHEDIKFEEFSVTPYSVWRRTNVDSSAEMDDTRMRLLNESLFKAIHADETVVTFSLPEGNELPVKL